MSLDVTELEGLVDDNGVRRDQWGRYMIVPPGEQLLVAYRRATTVVRALDAEGGLMPWAQGRAILGAARDPALWRKVRSLIGRHPDPWYAGPDSKREFKAMLAELARIGGSEQRALIGTNLHAIAAASITGAPYETTDAEATWLEGFHHALEAAGIEIDPAYVEALVVHDGPRVAGMADYLRCLVPGFDLPLVGDLKTGDSLEYSISGYAVQLGCYCSADAVYAQGADPNGSADVRGAMLEVSQEHGLIIHAPAGGQPVELWIVDLAAGIEGFALALAVEAWREREVASLLDVDLKLALERSLEAAGVPVPEPYDELAAVREWLAERVRTIGRHERAREALPRRWPPNVPALRSDHEHSYDELAQIEAALDVIEAQFDMTFGPPRPRAADPEGWSSRFGRGFPRSTITTKEPT